MTPEERAWKIYERFDDVDDEACLKTIAYQIRQAEEDAYKKGFNVGFNEGRDAMIKIGPILEEVAIKEAVKRGAEKEREECAKTCEELDDGVYATHDWPTPQQCAEAIRKRGEG